MLWKKWIISVGIVLMILVLGGYLIIKSGVLTKQFRVIATEKLERLLSRKVYVKRIETNFFNTISLHGLKIAQGDDFSQGILVSIDSVTIKLNLLKFVKKKAELIDTIKTVTLIRPVFFINNKRGQWNISMPLPSSEDTPLRFKIFVYRGKVLIEDISGSKIDKLKFTYLNGVIDLSDSNKKRAKFTTKTGLSSDDKLSCDIDLTGNRFVAEINLKKGSLSNYLGLVDFPPEEYKFTKGLIDANGSVKGDIKHPENIFYEGRFKVKQAALKIEGLKDEINNINGELIVKNRLLSSQNLSAQYGKYPFVLKGEITDFEASNPSLNLQLHFADSDYTALMDLTDSIAGTGKIDISGQGAFSCYIKGPLDNPTAKAEIKIAKGGVLNTQVSNLMTKLEYKDGILSLSDISAGIYKGTMLAGGIVNFNIKPALINFDLRCDNVNLIDFLGLDNNRKDIKGKAGLIAKLRGDISYPLLEGKIALKNLSLRYDIPYIEGDIRYYKNQLAITAKTDDIKYKIDSILNIKNDSISVTKFNVSWEKSLVSCKGIVDLRNDTINLEIVTSELRIGDFQFINKYYKNLKGNFNFKGRLSGNIDQLLIKGEISSQELVLNDQKFTLFSDFNFDGKQLKIISFNINDTYKGKGGIIFSDKPDSPYLDVEIWVENGRFTMLPALFQFEVSGNVGGTVNGKLKLKGPFKNLIGGGELNVDKAFIQDNKIEKLQAFFSFYDNKLDIAKFNLQQNGGKIKAVANINLNTKAGNDFDLLLNLENFRFEGVLLEGALRLKGIFDYDGKKSTKATLVTSDLRINKQKQDIRTTLIYKDKILSVSPLNVKDDYLLRGQIDFKKDPHVEGIIDIRSENLGDFLRIIQVLKTEEVRGTLTGNVKITGPIKKPEIIGVLSVREGSIKTFNFDELNANISVKEQIVFIRKIEGVTKEGGFSLSGKIDLKDSKDQLNLKGELKKLELAHLAEGLSPRLKEEMRGWLSGSLMVNNTLNLPRIEGNLTVDDFNLGKYKVKSVTIDFLYNDKILNILDFKAEDSARVVKISKGATIKQISDGVVNLDMLIGIRNINLLGLSIFGGVSLTGKIDYTNNLTQIFADITTDTLWVNQYKFDKASVKLKYVPKNRELEFLPVYKSRSQLIGKIKFGENATYYLDKIRFIENKEDSLIAVGSMGPAGKIDLTVRGRNFDTGVLAGLIGIKSEVKGKTFFDLEIKGADDNPRMTTNLDIKNGSLGTFKFDNMNIIANGEDNILKIQKVTLEFKDKLNIVGDGEIPFALSSKIQERIKTQPINLNLVIFKSDLSILTDISSKIKRASGPIEAKLDIKGSIENPLVNGYIKVKNGNIIAKEIIKRATDINVDIIIVKNSIIINQLSGKIGEGYLNIAGTAKISNYAIQQVDIELATSQNTGIDLNIDGFISKGKPKMRMHIYSKEEEYHIEGNIELVNTHFTYPPQPINGKKRADIFDTEFFQNAIWDVEIKAGDNTWYENNLVTVNITGNIRLEGKKKNFKVTGKVETIKGDADYLGVEFKILKATLDFQDNIPYLEGKAESKIENDIITLVIEKSKLQDIKPKFYSQQNPQLSQEKVISLLVYGKDFEGGSPENLTREELNRYLLKEMLKLVDTTLSSRIVNTILKEAGLDELVDVVKVKTMVLEKSSSGDEPLLGGSRVTFGKYFTDRIYVSYTTLLQTGLANKLELKHRVELEYRIQGSKFLKMRMDDKEKFMGIENQIRF